MLSILVSNCYVDRWRTNTRYCFCARKLLLQAVGDCLAADGKYRQYLARLSIKRGREEEGLSGGGVELGQFPNSYAEKKAYKKGTKGNKSRKCFLISNCVWVEQKILAQAMPPKKIMHISKMKKIISYSRKLPSLPPPLQKIIVCGSNCKIPGPLIYMCRCAL